MSKRKHEILLSISRPSLSTRWAVTTILRLAYGYNVNRNEDDPLIQDMERASREFAISSQPGTWLVDIVPLCKQLLFTIQKRLIILYTSALFTKLASWHEF